MKIISEEMRNIINDYSKYLELLGKSSKTIDAYTGFLNKFLRDNNIDTLDKFVELDNEFWLNYIARKKESISVATINKQIKQCSSFYQYLIVGRGCKIQNYCKMIPKVNNTESEYKENVISDDDARRILNLEYKIDAKHSKESNCRDRLICHILLYLAPRIEELSRIRISDVDIDNNKLYIRGKGHNDKISRYTNFNDKIKDLIIEYISYNPNREYLFVNYNGIKLSTSAIRSVWYKSCDRAGVDRVHCHECRHRLGSVLVNKGVDHDDVRFVLGHSKNSRVLEIYYIRDNNKDVRDITKYDTI